MKRIVTIFLLLFACCISKADDSDSIAAAIKPVLPKGWNIKVFSDSLVITGPKIQLLNPISLPWIEDKEKLWRRYSITEKFEMTIKLQGPLSMQDIDELRRLSDQFDEIISHGYHRGSKSGREPVSEFGFIRLPDYLSPTASVFIRRPFGGPIMDRPSSILDVVSKIDKVLESILEKVPKKDLLSSTSNTPTP